jgi:hypothetical protein
MPVDLKDLYCGTDALGTFWRWGMAGAKYYFILGDVESEQSAKRKACKEGGVTCP